MIILASIPENTSLTPRQMFVIHFLYKGSLIPEQYFVAHLAPALTAHISNHAELEIQDSDIPPLLITHIHYLKHSLNAK
jgi:hypothetical protein